MPMMFNRVRNHSPLAGLVTDNHLNVVDSNKDPIAGLYAAGNCLGGRYGYFYPTPIAGNYIGQAMTHGRVLGKLLAEKGG
jgi:predicted oxidoreductase